MIRRHTKRLLVLIAAIVFVILGLAGLVLPVLQGVLFLAIGLVLLSVLSPTIQEKVAAQTRKYPKVHAVVLRIEGIIRSIVGEL